MTLLIFFATLAIGVSFLCSLLEASLLSIPRPYVEMLGAKGSRAGVLLRGMLENIDRPLSAILTLNTVAHTIGAAGVGAQAALVFGHEVVSLVSAIMTLLILVLSEIIPKTLGAVHAKALVGVTAVTTRVLILLCTPIVAPLEWINRAIGYHRHRPSIERAELAAMLRLGREGGALLRREYRIVSNILALHGVRLADVLTPRTVMFALPEKMTVAQVMAEHRSIRFSRIPIYQELPDQVTGYVTRYDMYEAYANGGEQRSLGEIANPILSLPEQASVGDALELLLKKHAHIALVVDEYGGIEGLVTLEDVLETLLGEEIVDETDPVTDMRELARRGSRIRRKQSGDRA